MQRQADLKLYGGNESVWLRYLSIKNFRSITDIDVEFDSRVNVIVGPNAIGKTTVLEAIRLAKALLAPRVANEGQNALVSLGAITPYNPQTLIPDNLLQNFAKPLEIRCGYELTEAEAEELVKNQELLATNIVQSRLQGQVNPAGFSAYISSPDGRAALESVAKEIRSGLTKLFTAHRICRLDLFIDFKASQIRATDPIGAAFIGFLDSHLPPSLTKFSYFPADRALPRGEVAIQLGSQDAQQQLEAHSAQPQLKYARLKNTIYSTIVSEENGRETLGSDFGIIFSGILKGRQLIGAGVNQHGLLSIKIKDVETGKIFDIDGLSSGEKGLVLTFLLIGRTLSPDGIVLLDEPELHLNPAVCRDIIPFIVSQYADPKRLQMIICSHSPEILASSFEEDHCSLFHLRSGSILSAVRSADRDEVTEALRLLGTSESEGLLYKATIFVEGEHDIALLEAGFGHILRQYKLRDLGGRQEVEKQIRRLQTMESSSEPLTPRFFIFDKDDAPTRLTNSKFVRILQWNRRCLENYLLDIDAMTELLKDPDIARVPLTSSGEVSALLKGLAMLHLDDFVIRDVYETFGFEDLGRRSKEISGKDYLTAANKLFDRIESVQGQVGALERHSWAEDFEAKCKLRKEELKPFWDVSWRDLCDGKRLFREVQERTQLKMSLLAFKKRLIGRMRQHPPSDDWRALQSLLNELISGEG